MNEKLSALMDGELDQDQARAVIKSLGSDDVSREHWDLYHVIGETLRGDDLGSTRSHKTNTDAIFAALALEPTILAPAMLKRPVEKRTRIALAMAASVVTISAIGVVAMKQQGGVVSPVQLVQKVAPQAVVASKLPLTSAEVHVNDYLVVHRQFSNPGAFQPAAMNREARALTVPEAASK
jgi:sigma-E factor negative regulatory protein RseA